MWEVVPQQVVEREREQAAAAGAIATARAGEL